MSDEGLSPELRSFIAEHIDSVVQVEILLLLLARRGQQLTAEELSKELKIDPAWAREQLNNLCGRGILDCSSDAPPRFRYQPKHANLDLSVQELERAYADRRVTVINLIYAKPIDKLKSFADAFRIRRDKPNG